MSAAGSFQGSKRKPLVLIFLLIPTLIVLISWMLLGQQLPETLATHWSGSDLPDGFSSTQATFITCLLISVAGLLLGLVALVLRSPAWQSTLLFIAGLGAWTAASSWFVSAITTASAGDPQQAKLGAWLVFLMLGSLLGVAPVWLSGSFHSMAKQSDYKRKVRLAQAHGQPLPQPLPVPEKVFRKTVNAPAWLWVLSFAILLLMVVLFWIALPDMKEDGLPSILLGPVVLLLTVPMLLGLCRITVQVDEQELRVSSALLGFPLRTISLDQIEEVETAYINPGHWGGWGWRFFPGGSAVVFKGMDGLVVQTKTNKRFAVTMEGSEEVRDQLLARTHGGS